MLRTGLTFATLMSAAPIVSAQTSALFEDWQLDARGEAVIVLAPGRDDAGDVEAELFQTDVRASVKIDRVLENGAEIGVRIGGIVQLDHPQRAGFSGQIPDLVGGGGTGQVPLTLAPRGAFTGLTLGGAAEDGDLRAALETAFIYIDGGYGELLFGRDLGVARRFHEGAESVFRRHGAVNPSLDTSGIATVLTRSDLSGPAAKVSYTTPRILGLKLGVSYAPDANVRGLDRDPRREVAGVAEPALEDITEAAFNFTRRLPESGLRLSAYGAYARASVEIGPISQDNGTVEVWSTGARIEGETVSFGADWLTTDNAGGRYKAWSVSLGAEKFGLDWSATYGRSDDDLLDITGQSGSIAASRQIFEHIRIGLGVQTQILTPEMGGTLRSTGPVIEMSLTL